MHDLLDVKMIISIQDCNFHFYELDDYLREQDCIPVGCVPPALWPYLRACSVPGDVPGLGGGGCTWSGGEGVPGLGRCTWSGGCVPGLGVYLVPGGGGVYLVLGGVPGPGGCTWSGGMYLVRYSPPVNRITHTCKNITLPQLRCGR